MIEIPRWERRLLDLARLGMTESRSPHAVDAASDRGLAEAYQLCDRITAEHSQSFHFASRFLPPDKRRAIRALYAFCRISDDLVDEPSLDAAAALQAWRRRSVYAHGASPDRVALAWQDARTRFGIPLVYAEQLIDGVGRDLQPTHYDDFESLAQYCYGVASTVGLMSMHIIGFDSQQAHRYAVKLGVALQLTNILRDVGEDLQAGRLYLPQGELDRFGIRDADLLAGRVDTRWRRFMGYQIERARRLYQEALPGIGLLHRDGRFSVLAAAELYGGILSAIEANDYDVFTRRAQLSSSQKLLRLPLIWLRARQLTPDQMRLELAA